MPSTKSLPHIIVGLALLTATQEAAADFDFGVVLKQYQNLAGAFGGYIATAAQRLLLILITIDVVWTVSNLVLKGSGPNDILAYILIRVVWYGFLALMITSNYLSLLIFGFKDLGENASGVTLVSPAAVFWKGVDLITIITSNFDAGASILGVPVPAGLSALTNPFVAFALGLAIILILLAYTIMTAQYVMILVQMYFYTAMAPLLISFGGLSQGRDLAMKALSSAVVIGVRLLAIYFVLAVADGMAPVIGAELAVSGINNMSPIWATVGLSALLAILSIKVPTLASDILSGSASLSGADLFSGAAVGAAVGSAVTHGMTQVVEKLGLSGGAGSIAAAGAVNSPSSYYMTAAQQFGSSAPGQVMSSNGAASGSDSALAGEGGAGGGSVRPVVGENSGLSLTERQTRHDQTLGLTPENGSRGGDSTSENSVLSGAASPAPPPGNTGSAGSTAPAAFLNGDLQSVLENVARDEQAPPASVQIHLSEDYIK